MAFCCTHRCHRRVLLVAIVCGLLTAVVLGLGIWRIVIRIQRETFSPSSGFLTGFCKNGGTWENGRCVCTEEWKGLRCTRANFCENSTDGRFTFGRIPVGRYGSSLEKCDKDTLNAGNPIATRLCIITEDGEVKLQNVTQGNCNENLQSLEKQVNDIPNNSLSISNEAQILTHNAIKLTPENLTSATRVVGQIFNTSREASLEAKIVAVATVSQLLDASEDVFQRAAADDDNTFETLIEQIENFSLSSDNNLVVNPNVIIQSVNFTPEGSVRSTGVRFTLQKGATNSFVSGSISVDKNADSLNPNGQTDLQIWLDTSELNVKSCGFVVYQNDKLFQSKTYTTKSKFSQKIISSTTDQKSKEYQSPSVKMVFRPQYHPKEFQLHSYACVYWNNTMKDWDTYGCYKDRGLEGFLHCSCNHTTNFAVLMSFRKEYKYPESLDILSNVGCALSITGLVLTIIFQIVTRKVRKTSVTWVLVSLCTSMLIFNLLFVFGIENSNKNLKTNYSDTNNDISNNKIITQDTVSTPNPTCTAIAVLLHYFLLATFSWSGLSAAQLYFLLIRTMKPLPQHFILFISLIGWGIPAIVVAMTVGIIFSQNRNDPQWELDYRQEEICWLAIPESDGFITSPFLWSFILPVTIILISSVVVFVVIVVEVLWKNNQNLTSTKKSSTLKKIFSTLSIAVVFGITWVLAYFMLIDIYNIRIIFSYIFCLFNSTQGLQIFILYTVKTDIFQNESSKVLNSLLSSAKRVKLLPSSAIQQRLRKRMYNLLNSLPTLKERFTLLEPLVVTKDTTLSESDRASRQ